jgi:hypothetical protein
MRSEASLSIGLVHRERSSRSNEVILVMHRNLRGRPEISANCLVSLRFRCSRTDVRSAPVLARHCAFGRAFGAAVTCDEWWEVNSLEARPQVWGPIPELRSPRFSRFGLNLEQ